MLFTIITIIFAYNLKPTDMRATKKYIDLRTKVQKAYQGKEYINRFMHLLNLLAPGRYELNNWNMFSSIEDKTTQGTVLDFSDNPYKR